MFRLMIFDSQNDVNQFGLYLYFSISITKQLHIMFELQISSCKSCFNSPPEGEPLSSLPKSQSVRVVS